MAKKKPVSKRIRRVRVAEKGTLIIQPTRRKENAPGQKVNGRETAPPRLVGPPNRLRYTEDLHEDDASDPSTDPLNIVGTTRVPSVNQIKDELLNDKWSFNDSLYQVLLKGLSLARQRLQLVVAERRQKTISDDQTAERLKDMSDMMRKMTAILAVLTEQEFAHDG
ncbi:hypothetical protein ARMSODRAFT_1014148 [Armillaria solidipes]|uniref:Uncharacterized protein n=1 Tax=Armillaria solidipes TaxID=1076256 RepID=A0A2H3BWL0_9AGAR|nr:hypothetical protein ARMSODRAFT_1014148 [Armillaria solidipes]